MTDFAAWGGPGIARDTSREALLRAGFENYEVCSVVRAAPPCWPLCMGPQGVRLDTSQISGG